MDEELKDAIDWARSEVEYGVSVSAVRQRRLSLLADAAERSFEPKPKPELRCPYCRSTHVIVTSHRGLWYWSCRNAICWASGPIKSTYEEARASAEVQ